MKVEPKNIMNKNDNNTMIKKPSNFSQILKYMKRKFPSFVLFLHICISKYVFVCEYNITNNELNYIQDQTNTILFWSYFTFISLLCLIWEFLYHFMNKYKCNKKIEKKKVLYSLTSAFISLIAFQSTIFYLDNNDVFDCFMNYNQIIADFLFFVSYGLVLILSIIEVYCCKQNITK